MTVVALCRGYSRRKRYLSSLNGEGRAGGAECSRVAKAYSEFLNTVIDDAIADTCESWTAEDMLECIAEQVGFRRYRRNHLMGRDTYYSQKRAAIKAIAERLGLM